MTRVSASAPGKTILFGEHAVVYGQPALAVPVHAVASTATLDDEVAGGGLRIDLVNLGRTFHLAECPLTDPIALVIRLCLDRLGIGEPSGLLTVSSTVPISSGLGSGASVSAAICRALIAYSDVSVGDSEISEIVFESEKIHHGTPSGIDNTVICYDQPIYFSKGKPPTMLEVGKPFDIIVADTGVPSPTKAAVAAVRDQFDRDTKQTANIIEQIGEISEEAAKVISSGDLSPLGELMNRNHQLLQLLNVSSSELDSLVAAALRGGASGAKLSGGGRGGNLIAYCPANPQPVIDALLTNGASQVWQTTVE